jgi:hypothetical protein
MMLALLLLSAVVLRDDVSRIPPNHKWRYDRFEVTEKHLPVDVDCFYRVQKGDHVHLELMTEGNLEALRAGKQHEVIQSSSDGELRYAISVPGTFAIVLWNDDEALTAEVALKLSLDFSGKNLNTTRTLTPRRQFTVILLSFLGFLSILTVSTRQLLTGMARRQRNLTTSFQIPDEREPIPPTQDREPD